MFQFAKKIIKAILYILHIDITRNQKYDRQTYRIMKRLIHENDNCIDIGCHKGEILDIMLKFSPQGRHFAFEPIHYLNKNLQEIYKSKNVEIFEIALSNEKGFASFNLVKNAPAYSGLKQRKYDINHPKIEQIKVNTDLLDNIIPKNVKVDFIKIDVEGAEYLVLLGAIKTIKHCRPNVIFEFGLGGSDIYGTTPAMIYNLLFEECNLKIYRMKDWLKGKSFLSLQELQKCFDTNKEYYFIATAN